MIMCIFSYLKIGHVASIPLLRHLSGYLLRVQVTVFYVRLTSITTENEASLDLHHTKASLYAHLGVYYHNFQISNDYVHVYFT